MKTIVLLGLFILFLVSVQFVNAQTVDDVIDKYIAARGGKEKLASLKSIYMEGSREMMGNEVTVKITKEQGKLSRTEFEMAGTTGYMLLTDKEGWSLFPMRSPTPSKLPDEAIASMQVDLDIAGPLVDYVAKGHKAELLGKEDVDGASCYKIKLTTKTGQVINYWIDASTYLLVQSSARGGGMFGGGRRGGNNNGGGGNNGGGNGGGDQEFYTLYKDYRQEGGIMFAHSIETKAPNGGGRGGGGTTFDVIKVNEPVDPKLYKHD